ncbi:cardiolipin synthase [Roseivivax sp. CAU 1753]
MITFESYLLAAAAVLVPTLIFYAVWRAIVSSRTPQGAAAWVVFLLAAPWFALPSYLVFGRHKLRRYERTRLISHQTTQEIEIVSQNYPPAPRDDGLYRPFERLAGMPVLGGNAATLLIDGRATFDAIFAAIDAAEKYVCVQFYTIVDDELGSALADRLIDAANRGVAVRVIYDGVGSYGLASDYRARLRDGGVTILDPMDAPGPNKRFKLNFRNHRKTVIVDGIVGFTGGHNVSDTYVGKDAPGGDWRDTHVALRGPVVAQLQLAFYEDWHWATQERLDVALDWQPEACPEDLSALIVSAGPNDEMDTAALLFFSAISRARRRVWIATPYFIPDDALLTALKAAALRGCEVRLIVPAMAENMLTWLAAFAYFDEIRAVGVEVYCYTEGFTHQKVVVMDDDLAAIGTANFDNRSFRLNFETMALIFDTGFAGQVAAMLEADIARSDGLETDLADQPLKVRVGAPFARLLAPVL